MGKGGGGSTFKQTPDNLRSTDSFEGIMGICAGPIVGPARGLKSIRIDGTPLEDESGKLNFEQMTAVVANGNPAAFPQIVTPQLGAGGSPTSVNLSLTNTNAAGTPGPWVVKTLNNTNADFVDLRFVVTQLYSQTDKGIFETEANLELQMKPVGATNWIAPQIDVPAQPYNEQGVAIDMGKLMYIAQEVADFGGYWPPETNSGYIPIKGKTTGPFVHELRVATPSTGAYADKGWDVRIRLREPANVDADPNYEKRVIQWESLSAVYSDTMGDHEDWRGLSWLQLFGKASDQLTGIPEVSVDTDTKIVQVPPSGVFNPETRIYTGAFWDGSWASAYTNDPAWVINDAISDALYGLSYIAPGSYLNKWDALEVSKWCSQQVPDGAGGTHPRYSMNVIVDQPQKADEFVRYLAGAVGGYAWDKGDGEWRMKLDKPESAVDIFTLDNIVGEFQYAHTDVDSRYNDIKVTFLNEAMDFRQDFVQVFDNPSIMLYGRKPTSIVGIGCTNRQEALRRAVLRLRASVNETKMVSFTTNRRGKMLDVFHTILVADSDLGYRTTGRVIAVDSARTKITLRDAVPLELGVTYQIRFALPNPDYDPDAVSQPGSADWKSPTLAQTISVVNSAEQRGEVINLYLSSALPENAAEFLSIALEAISMPTTPKLYRILDVKPADDGEHVSISAIEIDEDKWDAADNVSPTDSVLQSIPSIVPEPTPPTGGPVLTLVEIPNHFSLVVNWVRPWGNFISGFRVRHRLNGGPWVTLAESTKDTSLELLSVVTGFYEFEICTLDRRGRKSNPLLASMDVTAYDVELVNLINTSVLGATAITINADSLGAVTDALPKYQPYTFVKNGTDITTSVVWAVTVQSGVLSASIGASTGVLSLNTSSGVMTASVVRISATYEGNVRYVDVKINKVLGDPPSASAPGGGGGGTVTVSGSVVGQTDTTTMVPIGDELSITVPSTGNVQLSAWYNFSVSSYSGSYGEHAQWYSWNGSAYVALGTETGSITNYTPALGEDGYGEVSELVTGLTAASTATFRLFMRNTSGTVTRYISGACYAAGA